MSDIQISLSPEGRRRVDELAAQGLLPTQILRRVERETPMKRFFEYSGSEPAGRWQLLSLITHYLDAKLQEGPHVRQTTTAKVLRGRQDQVLQHADAATADSALADRAEDDVEIDAEFAILFVDVNSPIPFEVTEGD